MTLQEDDGTKHKFACKVSAIDNGTCGGREHAGKRAIVWWHSLDLHLIETIEHAVQIEVEGKIVRSYERATWKLASAKTQDPWFAAGTTFVFLIALAIIFKIDRRFYEQRND